MDPVPYKDEYLRLLNAHLVDNRESYTWTEQQAVLVSILQTLFQIEPTQPCTGGIKRLAIRRLKSYASQLKELE